MAEEAPCPCKQKLSENEKDVINFGLNDVVNILQNPNQAAINAMDGLIKSNKLTGAALPNTFASLNNALSTLNKADESLTKFVGECNKLTDPQNLLRTISSMGLYADLTCALGIPGLDVTAGLGVVQRDGQMSLQVGLNAQIQLNSILKQIDPNNLAGGLSNDIINGLNAAGDALNQANAAINDVVAKTQQAQQEALAFIQKYTSINGLFNLVNLSNEDSCFKLGAAVNASLISPEFYQVATANATPQGGTSTR